MCRVISCVVGRGCLLWLVYSLGKTLLAFALLHFVLQGQTYLLLQISLDLWMSNCSRTICWNGKLSSIELLLHLSEKSLWALFQPCSLAPCSLGSWWHEYQIFCHSPTGPWASFCVQLSFFVLAYHLSVAHVRSFLLFYLSPVSSILLLNASLSFYFDYCSFHF